MALLLFAFGIADLAIATVVDASQDDAGAVVVGLIFAQTVLFATWAALGPAGLFARSAAAGAATAIAGFSLVACIHHSGVGESTLLWFGIVVSQWMVIQSPLWVLRIGFDWRLGWPGQAETADSGKRMQIGIRQMMIWTALVGVTMGVGRWLLGGEDELLRRDIGQAVAAFCIITTFNCLLAWPIVWSTVTGAAWPWCLAIAAVCYAGLTAAETATLGAATGAGPGLSFFWLLNAVQATTATLSLLLLRASGFRLARPGAAAR